MPTPKEWEQIRQEKQARIDKQGLGAQIGGLLHDAVALVIAGGVKDKSFSEVSKVIKEWLDLLYDISEAKKVELTEIKPVLREVAQKADNEFQKKYDKQSRLDDIERENKLPIINVK